METVAPARPPPADDTGTEAERFVLMLGDALQHYGVAAHHLEARLQGVARSLEIDHPNFFSAPTMFLAAMGPADQQRTHMLRVEPGEVDLEKLQHLDELARAVVARELTPAAGARRLDAICAAPPRYSGLITVLAFGIISAAVTALVGGGVREVGACGVIGLMIGGLSRLVTGSAGTWFELAAAFLATVTAKLAAHLIDGLSPPVTLLGGLMVLFPGLSVTLAMTEVATRHWVSGTARLTSTAVTFMQLIFGVALGERLALVVFGAAPAVTPVPLPGIVEPLAVACAMLGLLVVFRAPPRAFGWVCAAGFVSFYGARLGSLLLSSEVGAFVGALALTVGSRVYSRLFARPSLLLLVPGIVLLVPGSLGFRSVASLLQDDVLGGVELGFSMLLTAVSLVAGMLLASALVPPKRVL